jgi:UDP:flavonoid glycosyltransferase YjiC (YdhE family)
VVLVTQGTLTNDDFSQLTLPTLEALSHEPDVLTVVTTGGKPVDTLPGPLPANARVAQYLPFEKIFPKVDVLVTNGGFGTVNQALSFGVPLVTAGTMADRGDVNVRIGWSGVGIDLRTNTPEAPALRTAIRDVLDNPTYRQRAALMRREIDELDTNAVILRILKDCVKARNEA